MSMNIKDAMMIIEESGLLLERIKKYRTTSDERVFRDSRSIYDHESIKHKMWDIAREEGVRMYVDNIGFKGSEGSPEQTIWIEFGSIGEFGKKLIERLGKAVGSDPGTYRDQLYFNLSEVRRQSQKQRRFIDIFRNILNDRFGVPDGAFSRQAYWDTPEEWMDNAKKNYDSIEKYVEEKQYGGIHDLNYRKYRQAIKEAMDAVSSPDNVDRYVTNQYGFRRRIEVIYHQFRKFCRLFKREIERKRGNLTKPSEAEE